MLPWLSCGENVIVEVGSIKYKKEIGNLYVTINRVVWTCVDSPSSPSLQYEYAQVKAQRISPDSAPRVRLQLVLHDDTTVTFHFNNPIVEKQKAERERVKEVLVQLLQKSKKNMANKEEPSKKQLSKELEIKQSILQGSEEMFIMYKTLVSGGIITAEDFWTIPRAEELLSIASSQQQSLGVTSAFMSEARPEVDGCNSIQYNLTSDIIQSIFHTYPMIKRKHQESVPDKMTEKEFWTKFFQSQYFHRDKSTNSNGNKSDVFTNLAQEDEETSLQKFLMVEPDPLLDISSAGAASDVDGFGMLQGNNLDPGSKPLVRKYNHHSFMICQNFSKPAIEPKSIDLAKKEQLKEITKQDDLVPSKIQCHAPLNLSKDKLIGLVCKSVVSREVAQKAMEKTKLEIKNLTLSRMYDCIDPNDAYCAMEQITAGSAATGSSGKIPKPGSAIMEELRLCYLNGSQILRHFWLCFPVTTAALEEKVNRMAESIIKYKSTAFQETASKLPPKDMRLLKHLSDQLDLALHTHEQWMSKKGKR